MFFGCLTPKVDFSRSFFARPLLQWGYHSSSVSPHLRKHPSVFLLSALSKMFVFVGGAASAASFFLHPLLLSSHADKFTDRLSCVFSLSLLSQSPFFTRFFRLWKMRVCAKKLREIWCSRGCGWAASEATEAVTATTGVVEAAEVLRRLKRFFIHHKTYSICWTSRHSFCKKMTFKKIASKKGLC